jgi:hypothetical protein
MILSLWQLVLTPTPHFILSPLARGEANRPPGRRRACPRALLVLGFEKPGALPQATIE